MGIEDKIPQGVVLTTLEGVFGWMRQASFWPATFGLACCAIGSEPRSGLMSLQRPLAGVNKSDSSKC